MKQVTLMKKYPIFELDIDKSETSLKSVDEVLTHLKTQIDSHEVATFIAIFDHYSHTKSLKDGEIADGILDAKNIILCFGKKLPKPNLLGVRPRAIGVVELADKFILSFMEAPNPDATEAMKGWVKSVIDVNKLLTT
jgi:hypothetical protein